jgi:hypothetical protein
LICVEPAHFSSQALEPAMNNITTDGILTAASTNEDTPARAKRGRKPETPAQRVARMARQLEEAKDAAKKAERRMFAVVGEAMLAEAEADPTLNARIVDTLRRRVVTASAKADIAILLAR